MYILLLVFLPFLEALIAYVLGRRDENARDNFAIACAVLGLIFALLLPVLKPALTIPGIFVYGLHFTTDGFRCAYSIVTAVMWAGTTVFAKEYFAHERENLNRYWLFVLMTLGATQGVMLSADLMTAFIFFEILSFTSFTWVIHEETPEAIRAGYTYLFIAVIGGLILFMGLILIDQAAGTLLFSGLKAAAAAAEKKGMLFAGGICVLIGFGAKAGMFPVHVWLPKAHPVAPSPASALLSGILTKVGIYGILMLSLNALFSDVVFGGIVLTLGLITMFLGALLALFSVNLKRTLACSSMSQVGFILTGIGTWLLFSAMGHGEGEGAALALSGAMLHMVNHSLIKLVLFMCAGVVVMNLHALDLNAIRGYGRNKQLFKLAFGLGALGISGVPFFNGYISKTMLHEGLVHVRHLFEGGAVSALVFAEIVFLVSGGCTFAYMLKLFICLFIEKNEDPARQAAFDAQKTCMNPASTLAIVGSSAFMVILGVPAVMKNIAEVMSGMEEIHEFAAFTFENLKGGFISLGIGAVLYLFFIRKVLMKDGRYVNLWPAKLDLEDLLYRPLLTRWLPEIFGNLARLFGENLLLAPLARFTLLLASFVGRVMDVSLDSLIVLARKTVISEKRVRNREHLSRVTRWQTLRRETQDAAEPVFAGFTFAMFMTCIGMLIIFGVLLYYML
ncbi:MAG: complex I subunit 5 family protein [Lachnospiraceae bacterium]|nr:complex I subunit 5 family protein [Lachnospiraceae bacterium]